MSKPDKITKVIVDGDVLVYRAGFSVQDKPPEEAEKVLDQIMDYTIGKTVVFPHGNNFYCWLTGKGNFRYDVAKTEEYKANRRDTVKPTHYQHCRDYLQSQWAAQVTEGCEADDAISIEAYKGDMSSTVIVSVDKDFDTVPCWRYNFVKDEFIENTPESALRFFYEQVLTGDRVDNIPGIHGIGPKKAQKLLGDATTEEELFRKCLDAYEGDYERVVENGRLLHLQQWEGELWEPPKGVTSGQG